MRLFTVLILLVLGSCSSQSNLQGEETQTETKFMEVKGKIIEEQFVNKGGRPVDGAFDYFLEYSGKIRFIKFSDSEVTRDQLQPFLNIEKTYAITEHEGLWDTDDPSVQSRFGEYVVIHKIIE